MKKCNMDKKQRIVVVVSAFTAVLMTLGCLTGPDDSPPLQTPWETLDSAWKVVDNLVLAYNTMDLDLYMSCFREDFEFHLLEYQWGGGYGKQDSFWGYWTEELYHTNMFSNAFGIELTFAGNSQSPWTGDSTGMSLQLSRTFDLKVYTDEAQSQGYLASGSALFICREDSTGEWYIWQWWDLSDT
jgi:hypothetical protein